MALLDMFHALHQAAIIRLVEDNDIRRRRGRSVSEETTN
jgi:hypothetical protein